MGALFGPVGELREFNFSEVESVAQQARHSLSVMLSGVVRVQRAPRPRRVWQVSGEKLFAEDWAGLEAFALLPRDMSRPCWFFSQAAQSSNMLTPETSLLMDGHRSGGNYGGTSATLFTDPGGYKPSAVATQGGNGSIFFARSASDVSAAIPHGTTFTASVYFTRPTGNSDSSFRVQEIDQTGTVTKTHYAVCYTDDALTRLSITATTQTTTVAVRLLAYKPLAVADPCLTLTDRVLPYAVGRGCARAVIDFTSSDLQWDYWGGHGGVGGRVESSAFQIMEVG